MNIKPELPRPGLFRDRREAGRLLAAKLAAYANRPDVIVTINNRGGGVVTTRTFRGCTRTNVSGTVLGHPRPRHRSPRRPR